MAWKEVNYYQVLWRHDTKAGWVKVFYVDGSDAYQIGPLTYEDYTVMLDMLRNEKPVYYDLEQNALATIGEPVGEEES